MENDVTLRNESMKSSKNFEEVQMHACYLLLVSLAKNI